MSRPLWATDDIDVQRPNAARIYDYFLGGSHNFPSDRALGDQVATVMPHVRAQALANRSFLGRAVRACVEAGVRQFLDVGSGIPTQGNVHEVAQRQDPEARVVYVDADPVAVAHSRAMLGDDTRCSVIHQDLRKPDEILGDPLLTGLLDLRQPVAVLLVAVLHAIPDADDPADILRRLTGPLAPGSRLVIAHGTDEGNPPEAQMVQALSAKANTPLALRSKAQIEAFFDGFDLEPPGVVWVSQWRPEGGASDAAPQLSNNYVGVGRKRP